MATVYEAHDELLDRRVAIKLLSAVADDVARTRFLFEAQSAARLHSPYIVSVFDTGEEGQTPFIVMEYVKGPSLAEVLRDRGPLDQGEAVEIVDDILAALTLAHGAGVVHRDVKPANILLSGGGPAKLADFGIALGLQKMATRLTSDSQVIGTPQYLSPEQVSGLPATARSDLYALGAVLFEMLAGVPPFKRDLPISVALAHQTLPLPDLHILKPGLDPRVVRVVKRAMEKDPGRRFRDAAAMRGALSASASAAGPAPTAPASATQMTGAPARPDRKEPPRQRDREELARRRNREESAPRLSRKSHAASRATPRRRVLGVLAALGLLAVSAGAAWVSFGQPAGDDDDGGRPRADAAPAGSQPDDGRERGRAGTPPAGSQRGDALVIGPDDIFAFVSDASGTPQIYFAGGSTPNEAVQLTQTGVGDLRPDWSPDGARFAFSDNVDGDRDIYVMNRDGTGLRRVLDTDANEYAPDWSPDGTRFAFSSNLTGNYEVYTVAVDGTGLTQLTFNGADNNNAPDWAPDGERLVFSSNLDGDFDLYRLDVGGAEVAALTSGAGDEKAPEWSPDGDRIVFDGDGPRSREVYSLTVPTGEVMQLTDDDAESFHPSWLDDGEAISYSGDQDGDLEIYVTPVGEDSEPIKVTDNMSDDFDTAWTRESGE